MLLRINLGCQEWENMILIKDSTELQKEQVKAGNEIFDLKKLITAKNIMMTKN